MGRAVRYMDGMGRSSGTYMLFEIRRGDQMAREDGLWRWSLWFQELLSSYRI